MTLKNITPDGYECIDEARLLSPGSDEHSITVCNHGGLAVVFRSGIRFVKRCFDINVTTFEYVCGIDTTSSSKLLLLGIYRSTSHAVNSLFFDELTAVLEQICVLQCPVVICGDFNIHVDELENSIAIRLQQLLESFDCVQHVSGPTHKAGHTLDLVITKTECCYRCCCW